MGGKKATSTSQVTIPPEVLARYNAVNTKAEAVAAKPFQSFGTTAADYVAQINPQQMAGITSTNAAAGSYQPYLSAASGATQGAMGGLNAADIQKYMSPYLSNVADTTAALMRQSNEQAQSGALGTAAMSGAFGGDRAGIAAANLSQQNQLAMGKTMADIYQQGYGQALGTAQQQQGVQLQGAQQLANLGAQAQGLGLQGAQAQMAAGTMQQQTEQAGKDAMVQRFMQEQGYPFQVAQFLANIALGTGTASGSTTTSTQPVGIFGNLASGGRVDGYATGGGVAGSGSYVPEVEVPIGQLMVAQPPQQQKGGGLGSILSLAAKFMASGGVAGGLDGYEVGGRPGLDGPIKPIVVPEGGISSTQRPAPRPLDLLTRQPIVVPEGGISSTQRPMPRPPGLGGAEVASDAMAALGRTPSGLSAPVQVSDTAINGGKGVMDTAQPTGVAAPAASLFDTKIVPIESGGRQTDEAGRPLTSSAGAVGAAQVMEGTGPEAAKLAGLPWDRDRWMYDREYNLALGRAYFNEQMRQFGNPELAAAAYNAGPGAVRSAMDRATALGGSYLDYLPAETQNYVAKFSGSSPDQPQSTGGLGAAQAPAETAPGGLKPYEDRNAIGQFLHNPATNKLDRNAVLSVLAGLGTMASSRTLSPIAALLQGVGGGAAAYNNLQNQEPVRVAENLANSQSAHMLYQQLSALASPDHPMPSYEQWANEQFRGGPGAVSSGAPGGMNMSGKTYQGIPLDPYLRGLSQTVPGTNVQAGYNLGYLTNLEPVLQAQSAAGVPGAAERLAQIQGRIEEIKANPYVPTSNGSGTTADPTATGMAMGSGSVAADQKRTQDLRIALPDMMQGADTEIRNNKELSNALTGLSTGPMAGALNKLSSFAGQVGIDASKYADKYQLAYKILSQEAAQSLSGLAGSVDSSRYADILGMANPTPEMASGAIEEVLAIRQGTAEYKRSLAAALSDAAQSGATNLGQVERDFAASHPISSYVEAARPQFKGIMGAQTVAEGSTSTTKDSSGKEVPIVYRNGKWVLQ